MNVNVLLAGYKAHARAVYMALRGVPGVRIVGVCTGGDDDFCLLEGKSIGVCAKKDGIPVYTASRLQDGLLTELKDECSHVDILIMAEWRELIPESVFSVPRMGCYNIHDSLLPTYRGSSPMNWAVINGLTQTGATFYRISRKADQGLIYAQSSFAIAKTDYALDVVKKMVHAYHDVALKGIRAVIRGDTPVMQDETQATYCAKRLPQDGLLDFTWDVERIYNMIRALSYPFPGAFCYYGNTKVTITRASIVDQPYNYVGCIPGSILKASNIWVLCGSGVLRIEEIVFLRNGNLIHDPKVLFTDHSIRLLSTPLSKIK